MAIYNVEYNIRIDTDQASRSLSELRNTIQKNVPKITSDLDVLLKKISKVNSALANFNKFSNRTMKLKLDGKIFSDLDEVKKKISSIRGKEITITAKTKEVPVTGGGSSTVTTTASGSRRRRLADRGSAPRNGANRAARGFGDGAKGLYGFSDVLYAAGFPYPNMIGAAAIGMGAYSVVTDFAEFENIMTTVQAILKATDTDVQTFNERFDEMSRHIRKVGVDTKFTTTEVAGAAKYLAMAGLGIKDINNSMEPIANLAIINDAPLDRMADIVTNIQTAYGIASEKMPQIADILASVSAGTNTDVLEMGEAMKFAAPMMSMAGVSFNEAAAAIGLLANAGLKGTVAGTALRAMMVRLLNPTKRGVDVLKKYNIELYEMDKLTGKTRLRSLFDIFSQLRAKNASVQDLNRIFDKIGGNAANNVFAELMKLPDIVNNSVYSGGLAENIATEKQNTLAGKWDKVTSQFSETGMNVFEAYVPIIKQGLDYLNEFLQTPAAAKIFADIASGLVMVFNALVSISTWVSNNWSWLEPLLIGGFLTKRVYAVINSLMSFVGVIRTVTSAATGLRAAIGVAGAVGTAGSAAGAIAGGGGLLAALGGIPGVIAAVVGALGALGVSLYVSASEFDQSTDRMQKKIDELLPGLKKIQEETGVLDNRTYLEKVVGNPSLAKDIANSNAYGEQIGLYGKTQASNVVSNLLYDMTHFPAGTSVAEKARLSSLMAKRLNSEMLSDGTYKVSDFDAKNGTMVLDEDTGKKFRAIGMAGIKGAEDMNKIFDYTRGFNEQLVTSRSIVNPIPMLYGRMANSIGTSPSEAIDIIKLLTGENLNFGATASYDDMKGTTQAAFTYLRKRQYDNDLVNYLFNSLPDRLRELVPPTQLYPTKDVRIENKLPDYGGSSSSFNSYGGGAGVTGVGTYKGNPPKQIIVNIDNLIGTFEVSYAGDEDKERIKELITQTVIEAVQDSEISLMSNSSY